MLRLLVVRILLKEGYMNILKALRKEHERIQHQAESLAAAIDVLDGAGHKPGRRKSGRKRGWTMSAEARAKISRAQKARWRAKNKA